MLQLQKYMEIIEIFYMKIPLNPSTPYAISRSTSDFHLKALYKNYKFPVIFSGC